MNIENPALLNHLPANAGSYSTKITPQTKYIDILNGVLVFGEEKFSDTAKRIKQGNIMTETDIEKEQLSLSVKTPFSYQKKQKLDKDKNSICFTKGSSILLENGFRLDITENSIDIIGDIRNISEKEESKKIAQSINSLIKIANKQIKGTEFYRKGKENSFFALIGLKATGINITKNFIINETEFEVKNGIIQII